MTKGLKDSMLYRTLIGQWAVLWLQLALGISMATDQMKEFVKWAKVGLTLANHFIMANTIALGDWIEMQARSKDNMSETTKVILAQIEALKLYIKTGQAMPELGVGEKPPPKEFEYGFGLDEIMKAKKALGELKDTWIRVQQVFMKGDITAGQFGAAHDVIAQLAKEMRDVYGFDISGLPIFKEITTLTGQFWDLDTAVGSLVDQMWDLNDAGVAWTPKLQEQAMAIVDQAAAMERLANKFELIRSVMNSATEALWNWARTGKMSSREVVHAMAQQVFGVLSALAIENVIRGMTQTAMGTAAVAIGSPAAALHFASAKIHFATAAKAGVGAAAALAIGAASRPREEGGFRRDISREDEIEAPDRRPQEVHIFIEGIGWIQDTDEFARQIWETIQEQQRRAGTQ
jgi:hypothetical protein